ncbi:type II secretion system protein [Photobacterium ganghwense]|uniref:type II secretion system protein n=1 Tax=Photobacterium ganghwense TaxID=320778 RepID=UPI001C2CDE9A|nr:type II secretion system protein [Photobacterium ganghwense]MBV1840181.1 type II secretion system GspH family protein [Photobacterium ganghwense]
MKRQGGFTLIELVVVIVILGILAVTAAPRFLNLQGDARHSALTGLEGAMKGAAGIVYGKAAIQGLESEAGSANKSVTASGTTVDIAFGYPKATEAGIVAALTGFEDNGDWVIVKDSAKDNSILLTFSEYKDQNQKDLDDNNRKCYIQYTEAKNNNSEPTITLLTDACK